MSRPYTFPRFLADLRRARGGFSHEADALAAVAATMTPDVVRATVAAQLRALEAGPVAYHAAQAAYCRVLSEWNRAPHSFTLSVVCASQRERRKRGLSPA